MRKGMIQTVDMVLKRCASPKPPCNFELVTEDGCVVGYQVSTATREVDYLHWIVILAPICLQTA